MNTSLLNAAARQALTSGHLAHMVTLEPDGTPQISAVWIGLDDDDIVVGHMGSWRKVQNIRRDPRVSISLEADSINSTGLREYLVVRGTARVTEGGAPELLQRLAAVYLGEGVRFPPMDNPPPGFITRITPQHVSGVGPWVTRRHATTRPAS